MKKLVFSALLICLIFIAGCSQKEYLFATEGRVIKESNQRVRISFDDLNSDKVSFNAPWAPVEGEPTGYVKIVYITKSEFDSLRNGNLR